MQEKDSQDEAKNNYTKYFDATALRREYLIGDAFLAKYTTISRDFIWQEQNERFKRLLGRAWRMQFYRKLWGEYGIKPGEIRSLLDIVKLPVFDAKYLLAAQQNIPELGDFTGQDSYAPGLAPPLLAPFFGPRGTQITQLLCARAALFQQAHADDIAQFLAPTLSAQAEANAGGQSPADYRRYTIEAAGLVALEGLDREGLYLMEDAHFVELLSPQAEPVHDGMPGELVLTSLYKDDIAPLIRFNTRDIARVFPGESNLGLNLRRIKLIAE